MKVDLTEQLASLMIFAGCVGTAVMQYSSTYSGNASDLAGFAHDDLMWLGDSLTNFEGLGLAIVRDDHKRTIFLCDDLAKKFRSYQAANPQCDRQAKPTFDRQAKLVKLNDAIELVESIKAAVQAVAIQ